MRKSALIVFSLLAGMVQSPVRAQDEKGLVKELVQYVRDAQKAGLNAPQIRKNALTAGWPEEAVDEALKATGSAKPETAPAQNEAKDPTPAAAKPAPAQPAESAAAKPPASVPETTTTSGNPSAAAAPESLPPAGDAASSKAKAPPKPVRDDDYLIGEGDVLQIAVFGEPTASVQSATVRPDGKISMPLIKEVLVAGFTPAQVEATVQEQLSKVIRAPDVTVIIAQINSKKIFLTGAVKREGPLKYTYRMTVLQAISEAGGLTDYAKRKNIYVLHTENGRQYRLPFDYTAVLKGEHMEQNILLSPGDTIVVP